MSEIKKWVLRKPQENRLYSTSTPAEYVGKILTSATHVVSIVYVDQKENAKVIEGSKAYITGLAKGIYLCTGTDLTPIEHT